MPWWRGWPLGMVCKLPDASNVIRHALRNVWCWGGWLDFPWGNLAMLIAALLFPQLVGWLVFSLARLKVVGVTL